MICCITNRRLCREDFISRMEKVLQSGVDYLIMREKDLPAREALNLAGKLRALCTYYHKPLIVNSFVDVARAVHADGIHLPYAQFLKQHEDIRDFGMKGVSIHTLEEAAMAERLGADYVLAGNIFETACKEGLPGRGLSFVRELAGAVRIPIWAVGGITGENAAQVLDAGASVICMMSSLMSGKL